MSTLPMRINRAADEVLGTFGYAGVPAKEFPHFILGRSFVVRGNLACNNSVPEASPGCDHSATVQAALAGETRSTRALFDAARRAWRRDLADLTSVTRGGMSEERRRLRSGARALTRVADLERFVAELER